MSISLQCNQCGKMFNVPDEIAGRKIRCKKCDTVLRVPDPDDFDQDEEIGDWDFAEYGQDDSVDFREADFRRRSRDRNRSGKSTKGRVRVDTGRKQAHPLVFWGSIGCGVMLVFAVLIGFVVLRVINFADDVKKKIEAGMVEAHAQQQAAFDSMVMQPTDLTPHGIPAMIDVPDDVEISKSLSLVYLTKGTFSLSVSPSGKADRIALKVKDLTKQKQDAAQFGSVIEFEKLDENTLRISAPLIFGENEKGYSVYAVVEVGNEKYICETSFGEFGMYTLEQSEVMLKCIRSLRPVNAEELKGAEEKVPADDGAEATDADQNANESETDNANVENTETKTDE